MDKKKVMNILAVIVAVLLVFSIVNKVRRDKAAGEVKDKEAQTTEVENEQDKEAKDEDTTVEETDEEDNEVDEETGEVNNGDNEVVESVMSIQGEVKEIFENGDIKIESDNESEDPTVILKPAFEDLDIKDLDIKVGSKVIAFTKAGTPQTMELPMSFRYGAIEVLDEDIIYKAGIFDKEGLSDDGMLVLNIPEGEEFEFAEKAIVVKYKMSTKSIPEQVSDYEIIELAE